MNQKQFIKSSVALCTVVPCHNEAATCADFLETLKGYVGGRFEWETRVLIMAARRGFSISFTPISMSYPKHGRSSFRAIRDAARIARTIILPI